MTAQSHSRPRDQVGRRPNATDTNVREGGRQWPRAGDLPSSEMQRPGNAVKRTADHAVRDTPPRIKPNREVHRGRQMNRIFATAAAITLTSAGTAFAHHPLGGMIPQNFMQGFWGRSPGHRLRPSCLCRGGRPIAAFHANRLVMPALFVVGTVAGTALTLATVTLPLPSCHHRIGDWRRYRCHAGKVTEIRLQAGWLPVPDCSMAGPMARPSSVRNQPRLPPICLVLA